MAYDLHAADGIRILLSGKPGVSERKMMGGLVFMLNGNMCITASGRGGILVRVGTATQARVLKEAHVRPVSMAGRTMGGFVRVMPEGYRSAAALKKWVKRAVDFVETLPPKAGKAKRRR
jgi:TfoX/Sxy family transcriptional regulator of competence genes